MFSFSRKPPKYDATSIVPARDIPPTKATKPHHRRPAANPLLNRKVVFGGRGFAGAGVLPENAVFGRLPARITCNDFCVWGLLTCSKLHQ